MCISIGRMEGMHIKRPLGQGKGVLAPLFSKGGVYFGFKEVVPLDLS